MSLRNFPFFDAQFQIQSCKFTSMTTLALPPKVRGDPRMAKNINRMHASETASPRTAREQTALQCVLFLHRLSVCLFPLAELQRKRGNGEEMEAFRSREEIWVEGRGKRRKEEVDPNGDVIAREIFEKK